MFSISSGVLGERSSVRIAPIPSAQRSSPLPEIPYCLWNISTTRCSWCSTPVPVSSSTHKLHTAQITVLPGSNPEDHMVPRALHVSELPHVDFGPMVPYPPSLLEPFESFQGFPCPSRVSRQTRLFRNQGVAPCKPPHQFLNEGKQPRRRIGGLRN
jgi:hypothetical protein